jgi:hypothetical protein
VARWPKARTTLRQGIRVVGRTRRVAEADSDLHRGSNRSELRPSLLSQMNPDARGGGVEPADVHLGASSRLTCQQFIALENSVREGAIASGGAYSREMVGWLTP